MAISFVAQVGSFQACPMCDPKPHVGGLVIGPGASTVLVNGKPAALANDQCACTGPPSKLLSSGSTVLIENKPVARVGDQTDHGGAVVLGCSSILAG
jgi:uncharacterized Zn-binding protein involved in type VI secretion